MTTATLDEAAVAALREDFPILRRQVNGRPLVYLDSAASSQKPQAVIEAVDRYYREYNANIHRGVYSISEEASLAYEEAHQKVADFIGARSWREVVFVRNTTEAINLVRYAWADYNLRPGDRVLTTILEHHSNFVTWQQACQRTGATLEVLDCDDQGRLILDDLDARLERCKLLAITGMSNALGTVVPLEEIIPRAHAAGALVLVDGAQLVPHRPVDVLALGCDFLAFSGHKMLGPMGSGALYGRREVLEEMRPFMTGGEMIRRVSLEGSTWNELPWKFEAGTPAVADGIGLGVAVDYLSRVGMAAVAAHEREVTEYALQRLGEEVPELTIYGPPLEQRGGLVTFNLGDVHAHDVSTILDRRNVCVRAGHHCAMPLHDRLGLAASARASFYLYTTRAEIDSLVEGLVEAHRVFDL